MEQAYLSRKSDRSTSKRDVSSSCYQYTLILNIQRLLLPPLNPPQQLWGDGRIGGTVVNLFLQDYLGSIPFPRFREFLIALLKAFIGIESVKESGGDKDGAERDVRDTANFY